MADKYAAMEAFVVTVDENGFSPAARQLGVATSSVTRLVDQLEQLLGTTLLNRSTRKVTMTVAGEVYYKHAQKLLRDMKLAEENIRDLDAEPRGLLRIAMPMALGRLHIMPIVNRFMQECAAIQVEVHLSDDPVDMQAEDLDISIRIGDLPTATTLIAARVAPSKCYVIGSPTYLDQFGIPKTPDALQDHACLLFAYANGVRSWKFFSTENESGIREVELCARLTANNSEVLLDAVKQGLGLALLPDWLVEPSLRSGEVVSVLDEYVVNPYGNDVAIWALYPENRKTMKKVRLFVDYLKTHYSV